MAATTRLTGVRVNGIKTGYWSWAKKEELVQRLGQYEDFGLTPGQLGRLWDSYITPDMVKEVKGE